MGAGYIGCEQACIYNNFGSEVHLIVRQVGCFHEMLFACRLLCRSLIPSGESALFLLQGQAM